MNDKVIIGIPGTWADHHAVVRAIAEKCAPRFLFAGMILLDSQEHEHCELETCEQEGSLREAFEIAGQGKLTSETLANIDRHGQTINLKFDMGDPQLRSKLLKFTDVIRQIGGIAVKVETSGIAHEFDHWANLLSSDDVFDFYCAMVILAGTEEYYYSCGMHNFQCADCCISSETDIKEAALIMNAFNNYLLHESPALKSGHTFSMVEDGPCYCLELRDDFIWDKEFLNPQGRWVLERM